MNKRLNFFFFVSVVVSVANAQQWTSNDSLRLQKILSAPEDIKINPNAVKSIDFGSFAGTPQIVDDEPGLKWNTELPKPISEKQKIILTLKPYKANTPFNYDPIRKVKIKVRAGTWRANPYTELSKQSIYANWAKKCTDKGTRTTLDQIEASGLRYNPIAERSANRATGAWTFTPGSTNLGNSKVYNNMSGFGVGGLDFNAITRREFWDKSIEKRRARTLEVLSLYGDSTTVDINTPIRKIIDESLQ